MLMGHSFVSRSGPVALLFDTMCFTSGLVMINKYSFNICVYINAELLQVMYVIPRSVYGHCFDHTVTTVVRGSSRIVLVRVLL